MLPFPIHVARIYFPGCATFTEGGGVLRLMNGDRRYGCLVVDNEEQAHQPCGCYGRDDAHREQQCMGLLGLSLLRDSLLRQVAHNQVGQRIGVIDGGLLKG